jgi:hypothetical protein
MPTTTSLLKISCPTCAHDTLTTFDWLAEHGVVCEQCFQRIAIDAAELGHGFAAIELAWAEVDAAARDLSGREFRRQQAVAG